MSTGRGLVRWGGQIAVPFARVYEETRDDPKILALSDPAYRMWDQGLVYCSRQLTDGFIPEHAIHTFGVKARNKLRVAAELCREQVPGQAPLWSKVEGGYAVHDYLDWNDSADTILKKREGDRARSKRYRTRVTTRVTRRATTRVSPGVTNGVTPGVSPQVPRTSTTRSSLRSDLPPQPPPRGGSRVCRIN